MLQMQSRANLMLYVDCRKGGCERSMQVEMCCVFVVWSSSEIAAKTSASIRARTRASTCTGTSARLTTGTDADASTDGSTWGVIWDVILAESHLILTAPGLDVDQKPARIPVENSNREIPYLLLLRPVDREAS